MPNSNAGKLAMVIEVRSIHAIGHSDQGSFLDFFNDPVALLVSPAGHVFLGAGAIPGLQVSSFVERSRIRGFKLDPSPDLGRGWILSLAYGENDPPTCISIGLWTGAYQEILEWFHRVNALTSVHSPRGLSPRSSTIESILAGGVIMAMPGWAMNAARGRPVGKYKRLWMDAFLSNVCRILSVRYGVEKIEIKWAARERMDTWLEVFNRLLPHITEKAPKRRLHVCFEPLFRTTAREGRWDVAVLGHLNSFSVVLPSSNPRTEVFKLAYDQLTRQSGRNNFDAYLEAFTQIALAPVGSDGGGTQRPLRILTQMGTVCEELVSELAAGARIPNESRRQPISWNRMTKEMAEEKDFAVFIDNILLGDLISEWDKSEQRDHLCEFLLPLPMPISVGIPFATGDTEWAAVLQEALYAVAKDKNKGVRKHWLETLDDYHQFGIEVSAEYHGLAGAQAEYEKL